MIDSKLDQGIKKIFLIPYTHCDYAWGHTRRWHKSRYVQAFEKALEIMKKNKDFKWYIDTLFEELLPFIQKCPEKIVEMKRRITEGKIEITSATFCNPKIDIIGGETFIRNIIYGKRYFKHFISGVQPSVYTAIDLFPGYSQIPQLLKKGGYKYFRFTRPMGNELREFYWKGLDGTNILCSRGNYASRVFLLSDRFPHNYKKDWDNASNEIYEEIKQDLGRSGIYWLPIGCDDWIPLTDGAGKPLDILGLVREWNKRESIPLKKFATPGEYFRELENYGGKIPIITGVLDSASTVSRQGLLGNNSLSVYWNIDENTLIEAEKLSTITNILGLSYYQKTLNKLWCELLSTTGHAIRFTFNNDYRFLLNKVRRIGRKAKTVSEEACKFITNKISYGENEDIPITVFNMLNWDREDVVEVIVRFRKEEVKKRRILIRDRHGAEIPHQIAHKESYPDNNLKEAELLFIAKVPSLGYSTYYLSFINSGSVGVFEEDTNLSNPYYRVTVDQGKLKSICLERKKAELLNRKEMLGNSLIYYLLEHSDGFDTIGRFVGKLKEEIKSTSLNKGRVCWEFIAKGYIGDHRIEKKITLYNTLPRIDFITKIDSKGGDGVFKVMFPLCFNGKLVTDIPFGMEERNLSSEPCRVNYWSRYHPNTFYGTRFIDYFCQNYGLAIISSPGYTGYDFDPKEKIIQHILLKTRSLPKKGVWRHLNVFQDGKGTHFFKYAIYPHSGDWKKAEIFRKALEYQNPLIGIIVQKKEKKKSLLTLAEESRFLEITPNNILLSSLYRDNSSIMMRIYETVGDQSKVEINLPFSADKVQEVDFDNKVSKREIDLKKNIIELKIQPWEIVTLKISPNAS